MLVWGLGRIACEFGLGLRVIFGAIFNVSEFRVSRGCERGCEFRVNFV